MKISHGLSCLLLCPLASCQSPRPSTLGYPNRADLLWVRSWGYWLQGADIETLADSSYDVLVIDYSFNGTDEETYTPDKIQQLQQSGKLVLAYLSIGEAEDYRFYWQEGWKAGNPSLIGEENPDWKGNYNVKYWTTEWWNIALQPYLERILSAGFDGVYLDLIEAYFYWSKNGHDTKRSADRMVELINRVAEYGRQRLGNKFIVCPQNGISIINDASPKWSKVFLDAIDCVGMEDLFYNVWSQEDQKYRLNLLAQVDQAGKKIFNVEYIGAELYRDYFTLIENHSLNIIGYAADPDRQLSKLILPHFD